MLQRSSVAARVLSRVLCVALAAGLVGTSLPARAADDYPTRPIRLLVGFAAGGATDLIARAIAQRLGERLGQQVIVENRVGAGGTVAAAALAKAPADGYTLMMVSASHAVNPSLYKNLPYDTLKDFNPVSEVSVTTAVLVVNPSLGVNSVGELIALAKARPGTLNIASAGIGSSAHLAGELFRSMAGIDLVHVPFKGTAESVRDLVAGQVQLTVDSVTALLPFIKDGRLKALGVGDRTRSPLLPDVPTIDEAGVKGYAVFAWGGFIAPAGTPRAVIDKLNRETNVVLKLPEIRDRFAQMGSAPQGSTPDEFDRLIRSEIARFGKIIEAAGTQAQ